MSRTMMEYGKMLMENKYAEDYGRSEHDRCIQGHWLRWAGSKPSVPLVVIQAAIALAMLMPAAPAFAAVGTDGKEASVWREIKIPQTKQGKRVYSVPMSTVSPDASWAALTYIVEKADGQYVREIVILDLKDGSSRNMIVPFKCRVLAARHGKWLAICPTRKDKNKGYFVEVGTLRKIGPEIPAGFIKVFERGEIVTVTDDEYGKETIWIYDAVADRQVRLLHGKHKLRNIRIVAAKNRLVISGWPLSQVAKVRQLYDQGREAEALKLLGPMKTTLRTQLWTLPDLKRISEHSTVEPVMNSSWAQTYWPRRIGTKRYAYQAGFGLWNICSLDTGKFLYSIGKPLGVPKKGHEGPSDFLHRVLGRHRGGIVFFHHREQYVEANRIAWVRDDPGSKALKLMSCDAKTGADAKSVTVPKIDGGDMQELFILGEGEGRIAVICQNTGGVGERKLDVYRVQKLEFLESIRLKGVMGANIHVEGGMLVCVGGKKILLKEVPGVK